MKRYNENAGGWAWILGGLGAAAALFWWTHRASAAPATSQISPAQYKSVRDQMVANVTIDESAAPGYPGAKHNGGPMSVADIDNLTQVYFRADPTEMNPLFISVLNPEGYEQTVKYLAKHLSETAKPTVVSV